MEFSDLENIRIKLNEKGQKEFWKVVNEFGGVKKFSKEFNASASKMYNWKSKNSYLPIELVKIVFGNKGSKHVKSYKGIGRSKPIRNPVFPIPKNSELLTRIEYSVTVNKRGIPVYQTTEKELVERFKDLLSEIGDVPHKIYKRDIYELRYPKYLNQILARQEYQEDISAKVDEIGEVDERVIVESQEIDPQKIEKLYNKQKRIKLALLRQDHQEIAKIMSEQKERASRTINQL